jgi:hypothetical protein
MKSLIDKLPPEIAQQIDPDWQKNEAEYWVVRDRLLGQHRGQWIGFADGVVIASSPCSTPPRTRVGTPMLPTSGEKTSRVVCAASASPTTPPTLANHCPSSPLTSVR